MDHKLETETAEVKVRTSFSARVRRGEASWNYLYTLLGFALTIETGVASMFALPWALVSLIVVAMLTGYLVLFNGWFQNMLLGLKRRYEDAER